MFQFFFHFHFLFFIFIYLTTTTVFFRQIDSNSVQHFTSRAFKIEENKNKKLIELKNKPKGKEFTRDNAKQASTTIHHNKAETFVRLQKFFKSFGVKLVVTLK